MKLNISTTVGKEMLPGDVLETKSMSFCNCDIILTQLSIKFQVMW